MEVTLSGSLSWILNLCVLVTTASIIILGTWLLFNYLVWEILVKHSLRFLKLYKVFVHFIFYRKRFEAWFKKYEGQIEPGAND